MLVDGRLTMALGDGMGWGCKRRARCLQARTLKLGCGDCNSTLELNAGTDGAIACGALAAVPMGRMLGTTIRHSQAPSSSACQTTPRRANQLGCKHGTTHQHQHEEDDESGDAAPQCPPAGRFA